MMEVGNMDAKRLMEVPAVDERIVVSFYRKTKKA